HLTPARLVDLAEGADAERSVPHLAECDACRRALAELRATLADAAAGRDVPEPSPLFWEHLSSRVRDGVAEQGLPAGGSWLEGRLGRRAVMPLLAAAAVAVVLAVIVGSRQAIVQSPIPPTRLPITENAQLPSLPPLEPLGAPEDPSLGLLADYGTALDFDE